MEVAYGNPYPLARTQTAPLAGPGGGRNPSGGGSARMNGVNGGHNSLAHTQSNTASNYSMQSQPSSRSSDPSNLFPPPMVIGSPITPPGTLGGSVTRTDNIMNTIADASSSLFQICVSLRQRLLGVPGFQECLSEIEQDADDDTDPVTVLWRTFRQGYPLVLLYNTLKPDEPLEVPMNVKEEKKGKAATFKFLKACMNELKFPQDEIFMITDLYADDTTGFVKVTRVVNRVLDVLVAQGMIDDIRPTASDFEQAEKGLKRSQRQHIVHELVTTERTYVQHLEHLQDLMKLVEAKGIIPGDAIHDIFLNLNSLLDFQRRFLIRVEQTNLEPEDQQNWGKVFHMYEEAFKVYEPYIANQKKCEKTVVAEYPKLAAGTVDAPRQVRQMVESSTQLYGFLMKPFQRLSKYPLLLEDLYKKGDLDEGRKEDLVIGKQVAMEVLARTNKAVDREEKAEAVQELKMRVEDWKGHRVEGFGELLLYGTFTVLKSETQGSGKDGERQYHVYLFETILLCCKDIDLSKPKNKLSNKQLVDKRGKPKLQLKGRIFMQNVTDLVSLTKPGKNDTFYILRVKKGGDAPIFWKGDPSIENFIIRFATEDAMKKWAQQIESQRRRYRARSGTQRTSDSGRSTGMGTSATEFDYMRTLGGQLENPYADQYKEEDDEDVVETAMPEQQNFNGQHPYKGDFASSRNASSTSLRSRSTTGESGINGMTPLAAPSGNGRQPHPRFPTGSVPNGANALALRTRELAGAHAASPSGDAGPHDSYFSPIEGSPNNPSSSRTSASSGMYPFPRQQVPQGNYYEEGHGHSRFTAPAIARQREVSGGTANGYQQNGYAQQGQNGGYQQQNGYPMPNGRAGPGGPQMQRPQLGGMHSAQQLPGPPRHRSASSPDIHNNPRGGTRTPVDVMPPPQVPEMPLPYQQNPHMIPRSNSNSPNLGMQPPQRGMSPGMQQQLQRERSYTPQSQQQQQQGYTTSPRGGQYTNGANGRTMTPLHESELSDPASFHPQTSAPPVLSTSQGFATDAPTQLKVRVHCDAASQVLTLVVPLNISFQSLKDRIDAKLQRSTLLTLSDRSPKEGQTVVKLKFMDEDDFISILSDDDVQVAFDTWREQNGGGGDGTGSPTGMGEVDLYCK